MTLTNEQKQKEQVKMLLEATAMKVQQIYPEKEFEHASQFAKIDMVSELFRLILNQKYKSIRSKKNEEYQDSVANQTIKQCEGLLEQPNEILTKIHQNKISQAPPTPARQKPQLIVQ